MNFVGAEIISYRNIFCFLIILGSFAQLCFEQSNALIICFKLLRYIIHSYFNVQLPPSPSFTGFYEFLTEFNRINRQVCIILQVPIARDRYGTQNNSSTVMVGTLINYKPHPDCVWSVTRLSRVNRLKRIIVLLFIFISTPPPT